MLLRLSRRLVPVRACLDLGQNCSQLNSSAINPENSQNPSSLTPQSVDSPLLKFLQSNLCSWRFSIEIQPVRILLLLVYRRCELLLFMVQSRPPLRINSVKILSNHLGLLYLQSSSRCRGCCRGCLFCWLLSPTSTYQFPPMPRTRNAPTDTRPRDSPRDFPSPTDAAKLQRAYGN